MQHDKHSLVIPLLLLSVGSGWLLSALELAPEIDWVWTLVLAMVGLLSFVLAGFDKVSVVLGPFFLLASGLSVLRQTGHLALRIELPILVTLAGALLLIARLPKIPVANWLREDSACARPTQRAHS
jgi:hypothetical protein